MPNENQSTKGPWECFIVRRVTSEEPIPVPNLKFKAWTYVHYEMPDGSFRLFDELPVGAMWSDDDGHLHVILPCRSGRTEFDIDGHGWRDGAPSKDRWGRSGTPPRVTVSPSINIVGDYHGWVRDGKVTPDCEGRTYPHLES